MRRFANVESNRPGLNLQQVVQDSGVPVKIKRRYSGTSMNMAFLYMKQENHFASWKTPISLFALQFFLRPR